MIVVDTGGADILRRDRSLSIDCTATVAEAAGGSDPTERKDRFVDNLLLVGKGGKADDGIMAVGAEAESAEFNSKLRSSEAVSSLLEADEADAAVLVELAFRETAGGSNLARFNRREVGDDISVSVVLVAVDDAAGAELEL